MLAERGQRMLRFGGGPSRTETLNATTGTASRDCPRPAVVEEAKAAHALSATKWENGDDVSYEGDLP